MVPTKALKWLKEWENTTSFHINWYSYGPEMLSSAMVKTPQRAIGDSIFKAREGDWQPEATTKTLHTTSSATALQTSYMCVSLTDCKLRLEV